MARRVTINRKLNRVTVTTRFGSYSETKYYTIDEWNNRHKIQREKNRKQLEKNKKEIRENIEKIKNSGVHKVLITILVILCLLALL